MADTRAKALLLDRDGTLIVDVPYNGDPALVQPLPTVAQGLDRARRHGLALAIVSNQSGVGRGVITLDQVGAVNARVHELLGPFDACLVCAHHPDDDCLCRKPRPGMIIEAARTLGLPASRCALIGDIGADIEAATTAGALAVMVPTPVTRPEEVAAAPLVAPNFDTAVQWVLGHR